MDRVDLHVHSSASDGQLSPAEVVARAAARDVAVLALCDHDTTAGVAAAREAAEAEGVRVIPGVELTCWEAGRSIHLLGYDFDLESPDMLAAMARRLAFRRRHVGRIAARLAELGVPVELERVAELSGADSVGRPHLAAAMVEAGHVADIQTAFDHYLRRHRPAWCLPDEELPVAEAIRAVHAAGGLAVLAHPAKDQAWLRLAGYAAAGLDGLEVHHPAHTPELVRVFAAEASRHRLLVTGGSDNHGPGRPPDIGEVALPADDWLRLATVLAERGQS